MAEPNKAPPEVYLVGAGLSVPSPSNVLSWWVFNNRVLNELKSRTLSTVRTNQDLEYKINGLLLDDLDIVEFSEVIVDVFAGESWYELLGLLEGSEPNEGHFALASMMSTGQVGYVLSTNFDTLIELALEATGVAYEIRIPGRDEPPSPWIDASVPILVKLHGSIEDASTLVDLYRQKARGFSHEWRAWFRRMLETHLVTVTGFSGRDLEVSEDYLSFFAAAANIPKLTWLTRAGTVQPDVVRRLLDKCGPRGSTVWGSLPEFLVDQCLTTPSTVTSRPADSRVRSNRPQSIPEWFSDPLTHALAPAVAMTRLLRHARRYVEASALRDAIRSQIGPWPLKASLLDASWLTQMFITLGHESVPYEPVIARMDFLHALSLVSAVTAAETDLQLTAEEENMAARSHLSEISAIHGGLALVAMRLGDWKGVGESVDEMLELLPDTDNDEVSWDRIQLSLSVLGSVAARSYDVRSSALLFRSAADGYRESGEHRLLEGATECWAKAVAMMGEARLAMRIFDSLEPVATGQPEAEIRHLLRIIEKEWPRENGRFDEVLCSVLYALEHDAEQKAQVIEVLDELVSSSRPGELATALLARAALDYLSDATPATLSLPVAPTTERKPIVAAQLEFTLGTLGEVLLRAGLTPVNADAPDHVQAFRILTSAAYAFELAKRQDDSIAATIFAVDALGFTDVAEAREILQLVLVRAPAHLMPLALETQVRLLLVSARTADREEGDATEHEVRRIRDSGSLGFGPEKAWVSLHHAQLLELIGRTDDAGFAFDDAVRFSAGTSNVAVMETARNGFRERTANPL